MANSDLSHGNNIRILCDHTFLDWRPTVKGPIGAVLCGVLNTQHVNLCTTWCVQDYMRATLNSLKQKTNENKLALAMAETIQCVCKHNEPDDVVEKDDCIKQTLMDENLGPFILASLNIDLYKKIRKEKLVPVLTFRDGKPVILKDFVETKSVEMMKKPGFNKEVIGKARKGEELFDGSGLRILCDASFIKWRADVDGGALCKVAGGYKNINLCTTWCVRLEMGSKFGSTSKKKTSDKIRVLISDTIQCVCNHPENIQQPSTCIGETLNDKELGPFMFASLDRDFYTEMQEKHAVPVLTLDHGEVVVLQWKKKNKSFKTSSSCSSTTMMNLQK